MYLLFIFLLTAGISILPAADMGKHAVNKSDVRVMAVEPTVEGNNVHITVLFPREGGMPPSQPVSMQIRLDGFPLRTDSYFPRKDEIYNDPIGQALHIVIDNLPYFSENEAFVDALNDSDEYFEQMMEFDLPMNLSPGMHVARIFPVRSFNESLKGRNCFTTRTFYIGEKTEQRPPIDLSAPYLTYNEPQGRYDYKDNQPIMLDFYISNCRLSRDGYKVRLTIDGTIERTLTRWCPYYIYGLDTGTHTIRLQLLDNRNKVVSGAWTDIKRTISVD